MTVPRTLSLAGCGASDAALARLRLWLEDIDADRLRQLESDALACDECDDLDIDDLDAMLEAQRVTLARYRAVVLQGAHELFVEHGLA